MKLFFLSILLIVTTNSFCQSDNNDYFLFEKANAYLEAMYSNDKEYLPTEEDKMAVKNSTDITEYSSSKAYDSFYQLVIKYPESDFVNEAFFRLASIESDNKNYEQSKKYYQKIIDDEKSSNYYKRNVFISLALIAVAEKDCSKALNYITEMSSLKAANYLCGNEYELDEDKIKFIKEKCHSNSTNEIIPSIENNHRWLEILKSTDAKKDKINLIISKIKADSIFKNNKLELETLNNDGHLRSKFKSDNCKIIFVLNHKNQNYTLDLNKVPNFSIILEYLKPETIEEINVLNDISATALYGINGNCGVVILKSNRRKLTKLIKN